MRGRPHGCVEGRALTHFWHSTTLKIACGSALRHVAATTELEDLHATLRVRLETDQRAAPHHRVLQTGIHQAPTMPAAAAGLLLGDSDYRCRGRADTHHGTARNP